LDYDVIELRNAITGVGCITDTLIEIICTRSNNRIAEIKARYHDLYQSDLEKDVVSATLWLKPLTVLIKSINTKGDLNRLLVSLVRGNRDESNKVDHDLVREDATHL